MLFPAARVGDPVTHDQLTPSGIVGPPPTPPVKGLVVIEGLPAAHVNCTVVCSGATSAGPAHPPPGAGAPPVLVMVGSPTVYVNGFPAARWAPSGDIAACSSMLGDPKLTPARTVLIGGPNAPKGFAFSFDAAGNLKLGDSITVQGRDTFMALVALRLEMVGSAASGQAVLDAIQGSGKSMTITEFTGNNSFAGPQDFQAATPAGKPVFDGVGGPMLDSGGNQLLGTGQGSEVTIKFNPKLTIPNAEDPANPMPNDAVLFHEMNHGNHQMNGTYDGSPKHGWTTEEEHTTIHSGKPSEQDYLKERGYPWRRTGHGRDFEAQH